MKVTIQPDDGGPLVTICDTTQGLQEHDWVSSFRRMVQEEVYPDREDPRHFDRKVVTGSCSFSVTREPFTTEEDSDDYVLSHEESIPTTGVIRIETTDGHTFIMNPGSVVGVDLAAWNGVSITWRYTLSSGRIKRG